MVKCTPSPTADIKMEAMPARAELTLVDPFSCTEMEGTLNPLALVELVRRGVDSWLPEGGGGQGLPQDIAPTERGLLGYGEYTEVG